MKSKLLVFTLAALLLTSVISLPQASATNIARSICEYVAADDKRRMRSFLRTNRLKIRNIFSDIKCNGSNLLVFAAKQGSIETGTLMISKLPKGVVEENLALIQSGPQPLIDKANERVGG
jgi:hypothetical protein